MSLVATPKCLIEGAMAANGDTTQYTAPASTTTIIDKFTACNTDSASHTININIVPSGSTAAASNLVVTSYTVNATTTVDFTQLQNHILNTGDFISTNASASGFISIRASGRECK